MKGRAWSGAEAVRRLNRRGVADDDPLERAAQPVADCLRHLGVNPLPELAAPVCHMHTAVAAEDAHDAGLVVVHSLRRCEFGGVHRRRGSMV